MANIKEALGSATSITITLDSLAASATVGRASTVVDNTTNLYMDALLGLKVVLGAGAPTNSKSLLVYGYAWTDGTNYTESVTGTDAGFTRNDPTNLRLIGVVALPTASTTYYAGPFSVASAFGGVLPAKWGIACFNDTGQTLSTGLTASYTGVYATSV